MKVRYSRCSTAVLLTAASIMTAPSTQAQVLEEITVTASKREQGAQDVGIAIAAFTGDDLRERGATNSMDLTQMTPGVSAAGSYGGQFLTYSIRGVTQNDFLDHTEAPTSVYMDEAYLAMMTTQQFVMFDVERAEILKGPQGTLYGRNSTGGTVNIVTRKPTYELDGHADVTYGRYDDVRFEGALGGPVSESVALRGAVLYHDSSEILENSVPGSGDLWSHETLAGRLHAQFEFAQDASLLLTAYGGKSEAPSSPWQWAGTIAEVNADGQVINVHDVDPGETRECIGPGGANADCGNDVLGSPDGFTLTRPLAGGDFFGYREAAGTDIAQDVPDGNINTLELYGATANLSWPFGSVELASVTDYKVAEKDFQLDGTVSPARGINTIAKAETTSFSEELRLSGASDDLRWVAGVYYLGIDADIPTTGIWLPVDGNTPTIVAAGFQGFQFLDAYELKTRSYSVFGQTEFDLTSTLTAILGVRGTEEEKDFDYRSDVFLQTSQDSPRVFRQGMFIAPTRTYADESSDTLFTARAQLDYKPSEDLLFYGSFNRGVKAGGFNAPFGGSASIVDEEIPYDDETLNAFELGFKSTLFGGRARLNGSAFYYDYKDYQTFQFIGLTSQVTNNDAQYQGAELEFSASPADGWYLQLSAAYLDTEVYDVVSFGIVDDKEASFAPEFEASGLLRYEWPALGGHVSAQASFDSSSEFYYSLTNFDSLRSDSHTAFDARLAYRLPGGSVEIWAFVDNLTDERYETLGFDLSSSCGCSLATFAKPRGYGVGIRVAIGDVGL